MKETTGGLLSVGVRTALGATKSHYTQFVNFCLVDWLPVMCRLRVISPGTVCRKPGKGTARRRRHKSPAGKLLSVSLELTCAFHLWCPSRLFLYGSQHGDVPWPSGPATAAKCP